MRKVNDLPRTEEYDPSLFTMLLRGRGAFEPVQDQDGRYVEVDLSRQVMALIEDGKPTDVFHVSTGAFGTPTGTYSSTRSPRATTRRHVLLHLLLGQLRGRTVLHGPTYPASHGCVRNPEAYSVFIYD